MSRNIIAVLIGAFLLILLLGIFISRGLFARLFQPVVTPTPTLGPIGFVPTASPLPCPTAPGFFSTTPPCPTAVGYIAEVTPVPTPTCIPQTGSVQGRATGARQVSLNLNELGNSNQSGIATISENGDRVTVEISISGASSGATQPAAIHRGSCPAVGEVLYNLNTVVNGRSITNVNVSFDELLSRLPLAVNVKRSFSQTNVYMACGNIVRN